MSTCGLPHAFISRMQESLQEEYSAFEEVLEEEAVASIRMHPVKAKGLEKELRLISSKVPWHPGAHYLQERPSFTLDPFYHAGSYYVQEAASMMLFQMCAFDQAVSILDLCAAPGGKSTLLAGAMPKGSFLVSNEVIASRAKILAENMSRWGNPSTLVLQNDPADFQALPEFFDYLVIDAPCSGEGLFRKDPNSREHWSESAVDACSARQKRILSDALPALKPGGFLIYSTCTFSPEENEQVVNWLLETFPEELELAPVAGLGKFGALPITIAGVEEAAYRCMPHKLKGEGLFISRLRKKGELEAFEWNRPKKYGKNKLVSEFLSTHLHAPHYLGTEIFQDRIYLRHPASQHFHQRPFRIKLNGLFAGKVHRKDVSPSHEVALSEILKKSELPRWELAYEEAISYLRKEELKTAPPVEKGWLLVTYKGQSLGWAKAVGKRSRNHFPVNWRIRQSG
ncbi:MAG: hypothetical protein AAF388_07975 [Bacteroidota bacterium]